MEKVIGNSSGIVWKILNRDGASNMHHLKHESRLSNFELYAAIGWLAREGKVTSDGTLISLK